MLKLERNDVVHGDDGPEEEDSPWAEGWNERCGKDGRWFYESSGNTKLGSIPEPEEGRTKRHNDYFRGVVPVPSPPDFSIVPFEVEGSAADIPMLPPSEDILNMDLGGLEERVIAYLVRKPEIHKAVEEALSTTDVEEREQEILRFVANYKSGFEPFGPARMVLRDFYDQLERFIYGERGTSEED